MNNHGTTQRTASAVFALSLFGYPLVAAISEYLGVPSRPFTMTFYGVVLALALFTVVSFAVHTGTLSLNAFWLVWWLFWCLYLSRILIDLTFNAEALKRPVEEYLLYTIGICILPPLALSFKEGPWQRSSTVDKVMFLGALGLTVNLWIIYTQQELTSLTQFFSMRAETGTLNPITLGQMAVSVLILVVWRAVSGVVLDIWTKSLLAFYTLLSALGLIASGSRGPLFALSACLVALLFLAQNRRKLAYLFLFGVLVAVTVVPLTNSTDIYLIERISSSAFEDSERMILLFQGYDLFLQNPVAGGGIEPLDTYPHNIILESFMVFGVVSGCLFLFLFTFGLIAAFKLRRFSASSTWLSVLFIQYAVVAMVSGAIYLNWGFWLLTAAVVGELGRARLRLATS